MFPLKNRKNDLILIMTPEKKRTEFQNLANTGLQTQHRQEMK